MKSFKQVEAARREYHRDGAKNSVHRSSLTVPEIPGSRAEISFLNHFLLKRGYRNIGCRITAIDPEGGRIESRLVNIDEPRVYTLTLSGMVSAPTAGYLVEFFAAENLYIPFPAVMINHRGENHLNSVHAYNRVLNDVFEDDSINATGVREASIDVCIDADTDTFALFSAGPQACRGTLGVELAIEDAVRRAEIPLDVPRLCSRRISLRETFPGLPDTATGTLKLEQPAQFLFYGRMLAGMSRRGGAFTANHSYYDSSTDGEYWDDDRPSFRLYPYFEGLDNRIRMYPIMSPGRLAVRIELYDESGTALGGAAVGELASPGLAPLECSLGALLSSAGIEPGRVAAFAVRATPLDGATPTRINHQLVYGPADGDGLRASVNVSLVNPNVFQPESKTGFAWGQAPVGAAVDSILGLVGNDPDGADHPLEITFYSEAGELGRRNFELKGGGAIRFDPAEALQWGSEDHPAADEDISYIWFIARSERPDLTGYVATRHRKSGHFSGEHSF